MKKNLFKIAKKNFVFPGRTLIMGVLNVTPDSFSDGGDFLKKDVAVEAALQMIKDGADIIDLGGASSRPGAEALSGQEEAARVVPVISALNKLSSCPLSVDSTSSFVAERAALAGATMVNDISGLSYDKKMIDVVVKYNLSLSLMHLRGNAKTMQRQTKYKDLIGEIYSFLAKQLQFALSKGVAAEKICLDPGIGFAKNPSQNLKIIRQLARFSQLNRPILLGTSRKSFIGEITGEKNAKLRGPGTLASITAAILNGANIIRVHDVAACKQASLLTDALVLAEVA